MGTERQWGSRKVPEMTGDGRTAPCLTPLSGALSLGGVGKVDVLCISPQLQTRNGPPVGSGSVRSHSIWGRSVSSPGASRRPQLMATWVVRPCLVSSCLKASNCE